MTILRFACQVTCRSQSQNKFPVSALMFNIAQFRKFDLLLLIYVMTHHRAGWGICRWPGGPQIISGMRLASRVPVLKRPGTKGHRSCPGLDLRFA
jgi:hypothetical protein